MIVLVILIILHILGSYYSWYWTYPWFDIVVHIISGLWVALVCLWLATRLGEINSLKEYKIKSFLIAAISALLIGVVWELFENIAQITSTNVNGYGLDTAFDLISDVIGGILAYLYFIKRRRNLPDMVETLHPFYNKVDVAHNQ